MFIVKTFVAESAMPSGPQRPGPGSLDHLLTVLKFCLEEDKRLVFTPSSVQLSQSSCLFLNPFHQKTDRLFFRAGAGKTTKQQPHVELDGNFCSSPPVLSGSGPRGRTAAHDAIAQESCSPCCVLAAALMS